MLDKVWESEGLLAMIIGTTIVAVVFIIGHFSSIGDVSQDETAKACIAAGSDWVYNDDNSVYECKEQS